MLKAVEKTLLPEKKRKNRRPLKSKKKGKVPERLGVEEAYARINSTI